MAQLEDIKPGDVFGMVTVTNEQPYKIGSVWVYKCRCKCGEFCEFDRYQLKRMINPNCGCISGNRKVVSGEHIGKLTAIRPSLTNSKNWLFLCDCGREKEINMYNVARGHTKSCGNCNGTKDNQKPKVKVPAPFRIGDEFEYKTVHEMKKEKYSTKTDDIRNDAIEASNRGISYGKLLGLRMLEGRKVLKND